MATVYVLYSKRIDSFYLGSCKNLNNRLREHSSKTYKSCYTTRADDWETVLTIENLHYEQARKIEHHIKIMKSKIYIRNLIKYPELVLKLSERFV